MTAIEEIYSFASALNCVAIKDADLRAYTSFKIGGPADLLISPDTVHKTAALLNKCRDSNVNILILGKGSNILVSDNGFRGVVICTSELNRCDYLGDSIIECGAGVTLSKVCNVALENGLTGIEFAYGIPGSAGGAVYMNAGAYGGEMKDVLLKGYHLTEDCCFGTFGNEELNLAYRSSIYSVKDYFITGLSIKLVQGDKETIKQKMVHFSNCRKGKQPLEFPSAGSVFKRPDGYYAGALIEDCGLKGVRVGGAMVSTKHAGFIINTGDSTAQDVLKLIEFIQETVLREKGIALETEIKCIL